MSAGTAARCGPHGQACCHLWNPEIYGGFLDPAARTDPKLNGWTTLQFVISTRTARDLRKNAQYSA